MKKIENFSREWFTSHASQKQISCAKNLENGVFSLFDDDVKFDKDSLQGKKKKYSKTLITKIVLQKNNWKLLIVLEV